MYTCSNVSKRFKPFSYFTQDCADSSTEVHCTYLS